MEDCRAEIVSLKLLISKLYFQANMPNNECFFSTDQCVFPAGADYEGVVEVLAFFCVIPVQLGA